MQGVQSVIWEPRSGIPYGMAKTKQTKNPQQQQQQNFREGNGNPLQYSCLGPGGLQSMGSQKFRHDLATKQQP